MMTVLSFFRPSLGILAHDSVDDTTLAASKLLLNSTWTFKNKAKLFLPKTYVIRTNSFIKQSICRESKLFLNLFGFRGKEGLKGKGKEGALTDEKKASRLHSYVQDISNITILREKNKQKEYCLTFCKLATWDTTAHKSVFCPQFLFWSRSPRQDSTSES